MKNTLVRKIFMSLTGLFIAFFLIIHLLGNLQLLLPYDRAHLQYNWYSHLLSHNIIIEIIAYILYFTLIVHILDALLITLENRKSNGKGLKVDNRGVNSSWFSRNMGVLGVIILLFLVLHLKDYWYMYKFNDIPLDEKGNKDIFIIVYQSFKEWWYVLLYVIAFFALGFHLAHGIWSAFRTLGVYNKWYIKLTKYLGIAFAILLSLGFALIPIIIYLKNL
ncbi:MAG TPA: succinate dehydrogenase cytochrome b subunit [Bacteroidetes bacterium]|nr:succinate dehydrogenase cytochrome b subunit [Bacteroidota bacterium]